MLDFAIAWDWLTFAARWLHVVTAIAWIGSSFYFIALDLGLTQRPGLPDGVYGEEWQVHGGGFYHLQKYLVAPAEMPEHLTWFKWEAYTTWMSGAFLMALVYYGSADLYLIDRNVLDVPAWGGILISVVSLTIGWIVYDFLCKSPIGKSDTGLMLQLYTLLVFMAWGYTHLFSGRATFVHLGAFTATIMSANVFFIIIPNQTKVVAALKAGEKPDPALGKAAKQRSLHNNYLTLPVIFLMLSNHYPLAFATQWNWIIAALVFLMGVTIRHYFNSLHARKGNPHWTWLVTLLLFIACAWLSTGPQFRWDEDAEEVELKGAALRFAQAEAFEEVHSIVMGRCSMCHAAEPFYEGILWPPKGVELETEAQVARYARMIYLQAGRTHAMPPANVSYMEPEERAKIVEWYEAVTRG